MHPESHIFLSVKESLKGIPYGRAERPDSTNHGFKMLRGTPNASALIPEAADCDALRRAIDELNAANSPFLTVGCEKMCAKSERGWWMNGYLEFALNSRNAVGDAQNYFPLFFHFTCWMWQQQQTLPVSYVFELEPAHFIDANVDGFTVSVWVSLMSHFGSEGVARESWGAALNTLVTFLTKANLPLATDPLY